MTGRTGRAEQNRTGEIERQNRKGRTRQSEQESIVLYPGKGECADPVYEDAILAGVGGEPPGRNKERQLAPDTGGGRT
jgi:hypothetical protein